MADSTTNLETISETQSGKATKANEIFDAASPATLYGRRASACSGNTWGFYGGRMTLSSGSTTSISNGTLTLTLSATNYVVAAKATGVVTASAATTNWDNTTDYWRLYSIVCGASTATSYTNYRQLGSMTGSGGGGSAITAKDEGSNLTTALSSLDFVGGGVTATNTGGAVTVTIPAGGREVLSADRTYYVRTDGSDSNNGLANTSGGAFLTIQKAVDVVCLTLDCNNKAVTIQIGDGTYTSGVLMRPMVGASSLTIQGNSGTPTNVVVSATSATCFSNSIGGLSVSLKDLKVTTTTSGSGVICAAGGGWSISGVDFGACVNWHMSAQQFGRISITGNYTISGNAAAHYFFSGYGYIAGGSKTVTLSGTPAFSVAFAYANTPGGLENSGFTWSGSATGKRYDVSANAVCYTGGGGANYFPGNSAGTTATGAQYI